MRTIRIVNHAVDYFSQLLGQDLVQRRQLGAICKRALANLSHAGGNRHRTQLGATLKGTLSNRKRSLGNNDGRQSSVAESIISYAGNALRQVDFRQRAIMEQVVTDLRQIFGKSHTGKILAGFKGRPADFRYRIRDFNRGDSSAAPESRPSNGLKSFRQDDGSNVRADFQIRHLECIIADRHHRLAAQYGRDLHRAALTGVAGNSRAGIVHSVLELSTDRQVFKGKVFFLRKSLRGAARIAANDYLFGIAIHEPIRADLQVRVQEGKDAVDKGKITIFDHGKRFRQGQVQSLLP